MRRIRPWLTTISQASQPSKSSPAWRVPGAEIVGNTTEEYSILLSTGGPALRIYGHLNRYSEPDEDPILQWQDWGTPWTDYWPPNSDGVSYKDTLRQFAMQFYYGE